MGKVASMDFDKRKSNGNKANNNRNNNPKEKGKSIKRKYGKSGSSPDPQKLGITFYLY